MLNAIIRKIITDRDLTISQFANLLGLKSRTSIDRIRDGKVRANTLLEFEENVLARFDLSKEDADQLHKAIMIRLYGMDYYSASRELEAFMRGDAGLSEESVRIIPAETPVSLSEYCCSGGITSVSVFNCVSYSMANEISRLCSVGIPVRHFIHTYELDESYTHLINCTSGLLRSRNYTPFLNKGPLLEQRPDSFGLNRSNSAALEVNGRTRELFILNTPRTGFIVPCSQSLEVLLPGFQDFSRPLQSHPDPRNPQSYSGYYRKMQALENNRTIFDLRTDPGLAYIDPMILKDTFSDSPELVNRLSRGEINSILTVLGQRYGNIFKKRKPTTLIMCRDSLQRFIMSGRTGDHLPEMRPFTLFERAKILSDLLRASSSKAYFNLYLVDNETHNSRCNISCCVNQGIYLSPRTEDHFDAAESSDLLLTPPESVYSLFETYCKDLIRAHAFSREQTNACLNNLIQSLELPVS